MFFDDDRAARGEGAGGVSAADSVGEGEVGGAEDCDRAEGDEEFAEVVVGADGIARRRVDGRADPGAFADEIREHAKGAGHAGELGGELVDGESGFVGGGGQDVGAACFESGGDGVEYGGALVGGTLSQPIERNRRIVAGAGDVGVWGDGGHGVVSEKGGWFVGAG